MIEESHALRNVESRREGKPVAKRKGVEAGRGICSAACEQSFDDCGYVYKYRQLEPILLSTHTILLLAHINC